MIPAVIGDDTDTVSLARAECGGNVHVFAERLKFRTRLKPYVRFHRVSAMSPEIVSMYLNSFANDNQEYPVLVFASEASDIASYIEHNCIIWREDLKN